eukprot:403372083
MEQLPLKTVHSNIEQTQASLDFEAQEINQKYQRYIQNSQKTFDEHESATQLRNFAKLKNQSMMEQQVQPLSVRVSSMGCEKQEEQQFQHTNDDQKIGMTGAHKLEIITDQLNSQRQAVMQPLLLNQAVMSTFTNNNPINITFNKDANLSNGGITNIQDPSGLENQSLIQYFENMGKTLPDKITRPFNILQANKDNYVNGSQNDFIGIQNIEELIPSKQYTIDQGKNSREAGQKYAQQNVDTIVSMDMNKLKDKPNKRGKSREKNLNKQNTIGKNPSHKDSEAEQETIGYQNITQGNQDPQDMSQQAYYETGQKQGQRNLKQSQVFQNFYNNQKTQDDNYHNLIAYDVDEIKSPVGYSLDLSKRPLSQDHMFPYDNIPNEPQQQNDSGSVENKIIYIYQKRNTNLDNQLNDVFTSQVQKFSVISPPDQEVNHISFSKNEVKNSLSNLATVELISQNARIIRFQQSQCTVTKITQLNSFQIERISSYLTLMEMSNFQLTNKKIFSILTSPNFQPLWTMHSFLNFMSKTGQTGVRNFNLFKIDYILKELHIQSQYLLRRSLISQQKSFENWCTFLFIMTVLFSAVLLALRMDIKEINYDLRLILAPISIAWIGLLVVFLINVYKARKYYKDVRYLRSQDCYKLLSGQMSNIKGRNTKDCFLYQKKEFVNRFILSAIATLFFFYFGIFLKIYILQDRITFTQISPISFGPGLIIYLAELIVSHQSTKSSIKQARDHLKLMIELYGKDQNICFNQHLSSVAKIDFGLILNLMLIPGFFYGFWIALCMRFDGTINTNLFILLIPLWIIIIPLFIFTVLNGLATQNTRANKCEKITLSVMVPCKFKLYLQLFCSGFPGFANFIASVC